MESGQKLIVIRYGDNIVPDCIAKHKEVIDEIGYCWFGKIGTAPAKKAITEVLSYDNPQIILYSRGSAFLCNLAETSYDKPTDGTPEYYNNYLYDKLIIPKIYFKFIAIEELNIIELTKMVVVSSRNNLVDTLNRSMSSFFFAEYGTSVNKTEKEKSVTVIEKTLRKKEVKDPNGCKYKKDGKCSNKSCISYLYEFERPSMCLKQKH